MKTCPDCGTAAGPDVTTCVVCGAALDRAATDTAPAVPDDASAAPADQPTPQDDTMTAHDPDDTAATVALLDDDLVDTDADQAPDTDADEAPDTDAGDATAATAGAGDAPGSDDAPGTVAVSPATDHAGAADDLAPAGDGTPQAGSQDDLAPVAWPSSTGQPLPPPGGAGDVEGPALAPPTPDAVMLDESARNWGLLAHVSGIVASSLVGLGFAGPLLVWFLKRDDHPFIAANAAEALNFQLSMLLYLVLLVVASIPVITLLVTVPLMLIGFLLWLILPVVAAVRASRGESYSYPFTIGFIRP